MTEMQIQQVLETVLYAHDLELTARFYRDVLGLVQQSVERGRHHFFRCGRGMLLIFNPAQSISQTDLPSHGTSDATHVAFAVREQDMDAWQEKLQKHGVEIETELTWPNGGRSLYFRDPDGNSLEIATPQMWGLAEADDDDD